MGNYSRELSFHARRTECFHSSGCMLRVRVTRPSKGGNFLQAYVSHAAMGLARQQYTLALRDMEMSQNNSYLQSRPTSMPKPMRSGVMPVAI